MTALSESSAKNSLKRVFSVMFLADATESKYVVDHPMIVSVILMLLADKDTHVRKAALKLAEAVAAQPEDK